MEQKPVVYIFHGDDELAIKQAIKQLFDLLGDPSMAEMNTARLDGAQASDSDILNAAATMPFLAERRLVILTNPLSRLKDKDAQTHFCQMLDRLPQSAALVLVVSDQYKRRRVHGEWLNVWENLTDVESKTDKLKKHWLVNWAEDSGGKAYIKGFPLPEQAGMPRWILDLAQERGGKFTPDAAQELAGLVENDTRVAAQEIEKLLTYVNFARPVNAQDVQQLTAFSGQVSVFDMVDAVAQGSKPKAIEMLHGLLDQQDGYSLFPMVVRQFRQLIQVREILDEGKGIEHIQRELQVARFIAQKLSFQAGRFQMHELVALHRRLLETDIAIKTGEISVGLALDVFIAEMA